MNRAMIIYILGYIIKLEGVFMLLPCLVALLYREKSGLAFVIVGLSCVLIGSLLTIRKPKNHVFYLKEGCVATSLSWICLSFFGCLPFFISREIPSFTNALFETISGFTTTGASILNNVEALSYCMLFWRSFTHWIGGMGVLVFLLAIIPLNGGSHMNLMKAESPGPSVGKLVPKVKYTARILYIIYFVMTIIQIILLLVGHMPLFDSICTAFGTAGTGGFGIKNDSMMSYSPYIQWVVTVFMILFAVNFNAYYFIIFKNIKKALCMEELRYYFIIVFAAVAIITINIFDTTVKLADAVRHAAFQVASIISTSGFATTDFNLWPQTSRTILVMLMFVGACAGSTGGGIKVSRFVIAGKTVGKELDGYLHPNGVKKVKFDGKPVEHEVIRSINVFFITFILIFLASIFLLSFEGKDLVTNFTAIAACINNVGPGLELVGPTGNFDIFGGVSKYVLMFDMLAGRLELFPLLILFNPVLWKEFFKTGAKSRI